MSAVASRQGLAAFGGLTALVTLLGAAGVLPRWPGLVHLVALPPLDVFADLRWLLTRAPGYPSFVAGVVVVLAVRIVVLAALLGGLTRARLRFAATFYALAAVPAVLAAQLNFTAHGALYSRLFWPAVGIGAVTLVVMGGAPWTGERTLGAALRAAFASGLRVWLLAAYVAVLLLVGAGAEVLGPPAAVIGVPLSAALNLAVIAALRRPARGSPAVALATAAAAVVAAWAFVVGTRGAEPPAEQAQRDGSLLVMSGINSASGEGAIFELEPGWLGYLCEQKYYYSYAGTGDGQPRGEAACPIRTGAPYEPEDTQRPFDEQVELLRAQVEGLPEPVVVIGHSQAAWVAWQAAAEGDLPGVEEIVLLGIFPQSPIGWPLPGERGEGRIGGDGFRALEGPINAAGFEFIVDAPLSREMLATPDAASEVLAAELPDGVRALAVTAVPDLALMADGWRVEGARDSCPLREAHPYLPLTPAFHTEVNRFLDGDDPAPCPSWRPGVRVFAQALGVPPAGR